MSLDRPESSGYTHRESLALVAPLAGCPLDEARGYVLVVFGQDTTAHVGASSSLPPAAAARALRHVVDAMEAQL
jgi:hypothetical protein